MAYLVVWAVPGGHEIARQSFDELGTATAEADRRAIAFVDTLGSIIAKVLDESGNQISIKICG